MQYVSEVIFKTLHSFIVSPDLHGLAQNEELQCVISYFICKSGAMKNNDGSYFLISVLLNNILILLILNC